MRCLFFGLFVVAFLLGLKCSISRRGHLSTVQAAAQLSHLLNQAFLLLTTWLCLFELLVEVFISKLFLLELGLIRAIFCIIMFIIWLLELGFDWGTTLIFSALSSENFFAHRITDLMTVRLKIFYFFLVLKP